MISEFCRVMVDCVFPSLKRIPPLEALHRRRVVLAEHLKQDAMQMVKQTFRPTARRCEASTSSVPAEVATTLCAGSSIHHRETQLLLTLDCSHCQWLLD